MIILLSHLACLICLQSFDKEKDVNSVRVPSLEMVCKDFHACKWPSDLANDDESIALYFDKLNDKYHDAIEEVKNSSKQILTFSHFVPRWVSFHLSLALQFKQLVVCLVLTSESMLDWIAWCSSIDPFYVSSLIFINWWHLHIRT